MSTDYFKEVLRSVEVKRAKIEAALNEKLLNPRTTRHFFPFRKKYFQIHRN